MEVIWLCRKHAIQGNLIKLLFDDYRCCFAPYVLFSAFVSQEFPDVFLRPRSLEPLGTYAISLYAFLIRSVKCFFFCLFLLNAELQGRILFHFQFGTLWCLYDGFCFHGRD